MPQVCYILPVTLLAETYKTVRREMPAPSKRDKQSLKRFEQNKAVRARLNNLSKSFYRAMRSGDEEKAQQIRDESQKAFDKAAVRRIIHPNKASRKISRFDRALAGDTNES